MTWISVEERLPPETSIVLVKDGDCRDYNFYVASPEKGKWILNSPSVELIFLEKFFNQNIEY